MKSGVISSKAMDSIDVIALMIEKLIGGPVKKDEEGYVCFSIPAQCVDLDEPPSVAWHEKVFHQIFNKLGFTTKSLNEAMSLVFSEASKENFSAITFSFGAGNVNVAMSINGLSVLNFAISKSGDWIDQKVAENQGITPNKVCKVKEKEDFDLSDTSIGRKQELRIRENIAVYYENLINFVIRIFVREFQKKASGVDFDSNINIIISGGTASAKGFLELFKKVFDENRDDFPLEVGEIRLASDMMDSVSRGCLVFALHETSKTDSNKKKE